MSDIEHLLGQLDQRQERQRTAWDEHKAAGVNVTESTSTTHPPNSRIAVVLDGVLLTADEVDTQITHNQPLYEFGLDADETWVIGGIDRNPYVPGFESETGISFQSSDPSTGDSFLPSDVDLIEAGYGTLYDQALSGVPHQDFTYSKEGGVLHIENELVDLRIYKNGSAVTKLPRDEWEFDPFNHPDFEWDVNFFTVIRPVFDLYGAGDITFFMKLRDKDGISHLKKLGTLGVRKAPVLRIYNHSMSLRVEAPGTVTGNQSAFMGPLQYHPRYDGEVPSRTKEDPIRNATVQDAPGDDNWTVVRVYRIDINRREAATFLTNLRAEDSGANVNAQVRQVHRDFLSFGGTDPDDDSNWRAPGESAVRETSVQVLDVAADTVSIDTFTDTDQATKIRGEKEMSANSTSGKGNRSTPDQARGRSPLSELKYFVLVAQIEGAAADADLLEKETTQQW